MEYAKIWNPEKAKPKENLGKDLKVVGEFLEFKGPVQYTRKKDKHDSDPDYDNVENILSRLQEYNNTHHESLVHISCECSPSTVKLTKKQQELYESKEFDNSDSEEEGDVALPVLLRMLRGLQNKPEHKVSSKAFLSVLDSSKCQEVVTQDDLVKLWEYLSAENITLKELCLMLITKLCSQSDNVIKCMGKGILKTCESILSSTVHSQLFPVTVNLLEKVISHKDLQEKWMDVTLSVFIPLLLTFLHSELPLEFTYAIGSFFRVLTDYTDFVGIIEQQVIPLLVTVKDASAKLKEVYTGILMGLVQHSDCLPPTVVDQGIIPTAVSMIKEGPCGPQRQALSLLSVLTDTEAGISAVISNMTAVPYTLCCLKESRCRYVRAVALQVICRVSGTRRLGLCKELMAHIAAYLLPTPPDPLSARDNQAAKLPVRAKYEKEVMLWRGLDKYIELLVEMLCKEAMVKKDSMGKVTSIGYKPCIDMSIVRLEIMRQCVSALQSVCVWPANKSKYEVTRIDLTNFTDSEQQRSKLCKVNRNLAQAIWDSVGETVMEILLVFSKKLTEVTSMAQQVKEGSGSRCSKHVNSQLEVIKEKTVIDKSISKVLDRTGATDLYAVFEEKEIALITSLLEFLLVISLCSCKGFPKFDSIGGKNSSKKTLGDHGRATKSDTCLSRPPSPKKLLTQSMSAIQRPGSPEKQAWKEDSTSHQHKDLTQREAAADRRILRKCLYEEGIFTAVGPFVGSSHAQCQVLACQVLRCNIQPLEEKVYEHFGSLTGPVNASTNARLRPMSAVTPKEADIKLNQALHRMSPHIAEMVQHALGTRVRPLSRHDDLILIESPEIVDTEATERLSQYVKTQRPGTHLQDKTIEEPKPMLDPTQPISIQCRKLVLKECGPKLLTGLFTSSREKKKACVLLLQDLVHFGDVYVHMKLSEFGCMQKLLDFLRVNTKDELLEIIGLIIVQMLVNSDHRLKQIFNRHGGTRFLMSMIRYTSGNLKEEVSKTLNTVTRGMSSSKRGLRPSSAPVLRSEKKAPDIWDHIQDKWKMQDNITDVFKQWYK